MLNFKEHVQKMANKALAVLSGIRLLANSIRGINVKHACLLFKSCILPILTYGSILWSHGHRQQSLTRPLEKAQNVGLRWLLGAFKTTPTYALQHLSAIPPIHIHLRRLNTNTAAKLRTLPKKAEVARRLPVGWDTHDPSLPTIPQNRPLALTSPISKLANMSSPEAKFKLPYMNHPATPMNPYHLRLTLTPVPPEYKGKTKVEMAEIAHCRIASCACDDTLYY
ncbi:hypothetical protein OPQ81_001227 [Rhizoctonia solani]|nr:hypothetical protein OPQ81_001227 [Rhizoctonia solani]